jgi:hypothetical protein
LDGAKELQEETEGTERLSLLSLFPPVKDLPVLSERQGYSLIPLAGQMAHY